MSSTLCKTDVHKFTGDLSLRERFTDFLQHLLGKTLFLKKHKTPQPTLCIWMDFLACAMKT